MAHLVSAARVLPPTELAAAHAMRTAATVHGVPLELLVSLSFEESQHDTAYVNGDARGLFGLSYERARALDADPHNPVDACDAVAALLRGWRDHFHGSWAHAVAAYHWGQARVERVRRGETVDFPARVHRYIERVLDGAGMARPVRVVVNGESL